MWETRDGKRPLVRARRGSKVILKGKKMVKVNIQGFGGRHVMERDHLEELGVDGR